MVLQNQMVLQNRKTLQNQMALQQNNLSLFQQDKTREWDKTRIPLDALKGIAILGIVLYHAFPSYVQGGFLGVPLFFVLSGYLMFTTTLQKWRSGSFHICDYYQNRIKKIMFPCFVMVMCVCAYMTIRNSPQMIGIRQQVASIFLGYNNWWQIAQNASYFEKHTASSPFTHLWYLSVEMQFYLIWPLLFWGYCRLSKRKYKGDIVGNAKYRKLGKEVYQNAKRNDQRRGIAGVCFGGLALLSVFAMILRYVPGQDPSRVYYGTDTMAFNVLLGILLGALRQNYSFWRVQFPAFWRRICSVITLCTIVVLFHFVYGTDSLLYQGGMFVISVWYMLLINFIENHKKAVTNSFCANCLAVVGKYSFYLYLWHYPILVLL